MTQLYVYESGTQDQPAILFLHGSPLSGRMWLPQLERLTDFHCLAPDLPEHGRSAQVGPFDMQAAVRMLVDLIRTSSPPGKAHVVGLSFGGVVAQALMVQAPEVVDHVILSGTAARLGKTLLGLLRMQIDLNRPILRHLPPKRVASLVRWQFGIPVAYSAMLEEDMLIVPPESMARFLLATYASIETPAQTHSPVLVVVGQKETPFAKWFARKIRKTISGAKGAIVPGLGHVWNLEAPDLFAETVRAWVTGLPLPETLLPF